MKEELKYAIYMIGLGASLIAYAHSTFSTKREVKSISTMLETIDKRVYDLHTKIIKEN